MKDFERLMKMLDDGKSGKWKRKKLIKRTTVNGFLISTVLPADTNGLYETMIFQCEESGEVSNWAELDVHHYKTKEEALKEHNVLVEKWEVME